jgi:hypothetical protein
VDADGDGHGREVAIDTTKMPRIEPLSYEDADEQTKAYWDASGKPHWENGHPVFRTFVRHPDLMAVHSPFVQYVKTSTTLPVRHRELAILRSAWLGGVDDQYVNHARIGLACGLSDDDVDRIPEGAQASGWSTDDAVVLTAVDELHFACRVGDETWAGLARIYDERQLIELLLLVGNYRTLSYVQSSIGIRPITGTTPNIPGNRFLFPES